MRRRHSLRWRMPVLIAGLVAVATATFAWVSYREVDRTTRQAAGDRARFAADQVLDLLRRSAEQRQADLRAAALRPEFAAHLRTPTPETERAVLALFGSGAVARQSLEVIDSTGRVVAARPQSIPLAAPPADAAAPAQLVLTADDSVLVRFTAPVSAGDVGASPVGHLVLTRPLATGPAAEQLRNLVGVGARLTVGAESAGLWTDLTARVPSPPAAGDGVARYDAPDGEARLGAFSTADGSPWRVWVDFPEADVLAPARAYLLNMLAVAGLFVVGALVAGAVLGGRITRPLAELTSASEALSVGDYSQTVAEGRPDELGRLGRTFNSMGRQIRDAQQSLQARVRETTDALAALRESEARHRAIVQVALDCIITIDATGTVTEFNPAAEQTFGYRREEAMGRELADLIIPPEYRTAHREGLARYLRTEEGQVVGRRSELTAMRADGSRFPVELSIQAVRVGGRLMFTAYLRNITMRKDAEESRVRAIELQAENRQVREASRLKSEFLANMSHELRTPLNSIIGFSTILHEGRVEVTPEEAKEFLGHVRSSGEHLLQLINDVLDLSKVEAGKLEFRPEPVDLAILVDEVMGTMRPAADARHIQTTVAVEPDARDAVLDAARLKQILYNYISNAIKFTPEGGRIAVRVRAGADDIVRLEVEDTGIGIAAGDQHRLFVEFQQLDHGAAKQHGGTGLGLALTKRLVERQGGRVGVESEPGTGSLFFAELPRRQAAAPFRTLTTAQGSPASGPTILVIEDDAADRRQLIEILSAAGYHVLAVERGSDALELCATHRVDAVTLDLLLPDQSGLDLLQQIRRHSANPDVPVVVVTVITESHVMAGHVVADVLQKPITGEALLGSLRRAGVAAPGGERVLVVDDDESARRLAAVTLEQAGYRVEVHADPRRGLQAARARPPAAIVLDLLMPDIDGFQFLHQLRDDEATRATPVIVWTVKDLSPEEADRLAGMVRRVVQKGMSAGELLRELEAVLPPVRREPA